LYIDTRGEGSDVSNALVLDSASSTLGFCPNYTTDAIATGKACCNVYGNAGAQEGFSGEQHVGEITIGSGTNRVSAPGESFCVMGAEKMWACLEDRDGKTLGGIIGFGPYAAANGVWDRPPVTLAEMDEKGIVPACLAFGGGATHPTPFITSLLSGYDHGQFGLYWSGEIGENTGTLFLGEDATSNEHFRKGNVQWARLPNSQTEPTLWNVYVVEYTMTLTKTADGSSETVTVPGPPNQVSSVDANDPVTQNPSVDTGTAQLQVPLNVLAAGNKLVGALKPADYDLQLVIELLGVSGGDNVTLSFDLKDLIAKKRVGPINGIPHLGLAIMYAYPYVLFDLQNDRIGFGS